MINLIRLQFSFFFFSHSVSVEQESYRQALHYSHVLVIHTNIMKKKPQKLIDRGIHKAP